MINLEEGVPRMIAGATPGETRFYELSAVAQDGKAVFYSTAADGRVFSTTIDTKETREFMPQVKAAGLRLGRFSWLGSRFVVFESQNKIWAAAIPEGQPFEVFSLPKELADYSISDIRCSPDGKFLTFGVDSDKVEYWVMENFLPPEKLAVK